MRGYSGVIGLVAIAILALALTASLVGTDSLAFQSPQPTMSPLPKSTSTPRPSPTPTIMCGDGCPMPWWIPVYWVPYNDCTTECVRCSAGIEGKCNQIFAWNVECDQSCMEAVSNPPYGVPGPELPVSVSPLATPAPTATPQPDHCFVFGFPCTDWNPGAPEGCICFCGEEKMWCPD